MIPRVAASVAFLLFSTALMVPGQDVSLSEPKLGFDGTYRSGYWASLSTKVRTDASALRDKVRLSVSGSDGTYYGIVRELETVDSTGDRLDFMIPVPRERFSVSAQLYSETRELHSETWEFDTVELPRQLVVIVAQSKALEPLFEAHGTLAQNARVVRVAPGELPTKSLGYDAVDTVVLYNASLATTEPGAVRALERWTRRGGQVITVGGAHLSSEDAHRIEPLLPGTVTELSRGMPSTWNELFPLGIAGSPSTIYFSHLEPSASARTVPGGETPLLSYQDRGKGSVSFVATDLRTLSRIAMPGSGLWREAFPPLTQAGRIRFPTSTERRMRDGLVGNVALLGSRMLFPRRATVTLAGLLYVVVIAVATRSVARGYRPPRAAVLLPALAAAALTAALLLGAERGSWAPPASIAKSELFRGTAPGHGSPPSPGVLQTDVLIVSRTGGEVELHLSDNLHPIPLRGGTLTVYEQSDRRTLKPVVARGEERNYYIQSSMSLAVTAELSLSSSGVGLSLQNATGTRIEDAYVLWNETVFCLGSVPPGDRLRASLIDDMSTSELRRRVPADRAAALRNILQRLGSTVEPKLLVFFEQPFEKLLTSAHIGSHAFSAGLLSLSHPAARRIAGRNNSP